MALPLFIIPPLYKKRADPYGSALFLYNGGMMNKGNAITKFPYLVLDFGFTHL